MCVSCGCGVPDDAHGDGRNITIEHLQAAAAAARTTPRRVLKNMRRSLDVMEGKEAAGEIEEDEAITGTRGLQEAARPLTGIGEPLSKRDVGQFQGQGQPPLQKY